MMVVERKGNSLQLWLPALNDYFMNSLMIMAELACASITGL